jgi:hypothetical protein
MKVYLIFLAMLFSQGSFGQDLNIQIIDSQGFSIESLFRGVIGMASLVNFWDDVIDTTNNNSSLKIH